MTNRAPAPLSNDSLLAIHDAKTISTLARAVFRTVESDMPSTSMIAALRPLEFELPGLVSRAAHKKIFDRYIRTDHKLDIWLKRSPIHPRVTVVRHSDYTPHSLLIRTKFYERVLRPMNADFAVSLVVWRATTWLATFTVFRSLRQGDFEAADLAYLRGLRRHVASAIKRLAAQQEQNLSRQGLDVFAEHSPQGVLVLDWQLNVVHHNQAARGLVRRWSGEKAPARPRLDLRLPDDLRAALTEMRPAIAATKPNRPLAPRHLHLRALVKRRTERLIARISFIPAKSLAISKGSFLVVISEIAPDSARPVGFDQLSRREAACIKCVAQGMSNPAIARKLNVSPHTVRNQVSSALRKLRMKTRYEVAAAVAQAGGMF